MAQSTQESSRNLAIYEHRHGGAAMQMDDT
jgi:hypothetical protein